MRTRCATGLRHSPLQAERIPSRLTGATTGWPSCRTPPRACEWWGQEGPLSEAAHAAGLVLVDVGEPDVVVVQTDHRALLPTHRRRRAGHHHTGTELGDRRERDARVRQLG